MTREKKEIELARASMLKTLRAAVRLKHSLEADRELNTLLPEAERKFDDKVSKGELPDPSKFLEAFDA